jgi:hypothetical protein
MQAPLGIKKTGGTPVSPKAETRRVNGARTIPGSSLTGLHSHERRG